MKQSLQLKLGQQLTMTPQLQQAIRLLQLSTLDLQQEIQEALDSNPMLEVEDSFDAPSEAKSEFDDIDYPRQQEVAADTSSSDDNFSESFSGEISYTESSGEKFDDGFGESSFSEGESFAEADNYAGTDDYSDSASEWNEAIPSELPVDTSWDDVYQAAASSSSSNYDNEDGDFESRRAVTESIFDHLTWQLNLTPMSDRDRIVAMAIIDAVEPSGMLSVTLEDIYEGLAKDLEELDLDEVVAVQHRIQQFDPCGVCSQNLAECLTVQLQQFNPATPFLAEAILIAKQYLPLLASAISAN